MIDGLVAFGRVERAENGLMYMYMWFYKEGLIRHRLTRSFLRTPWKCFKFQADRFGVFGIVWITGSFMHRTGIYRLILLFLRAPFCDIVIIRAFYIIVCNDFIIVTRLIFVLLLFWFDSELHLHLLDIARDLQCLSQLIRKPDYHHIDAKISRIFQRNCYPEASISNRAQKIWGIKNVIILIGRCNRISIQMFFHIITEIAPIIICFPSLLHFTATR